MRPISVANIQAIRAAEVEPFYIAALTEKGETVPFWTGSTADRDLDIHGVAYAARSGLLGITPPKTARGAQRDMSAIAIFDPEWQVKNHFEQSGRYIGWTMEWALWCLRTDGAPMFRLTGYKGRIVHYTNKATGEAPNFTRLSTVIATGPITSYSRDTRKYATEDQLRKTPGYETTDTKHPPQPLPLGSRL